MNRNIISLILIILAVGIYATFTRVKITEMQSTRVLNEQYSTAISNADRLISKRDKTLDSYNAIPQEDRDRLNKMVPNTVDNIRLIIDLNSIALRHGFSLRNVKAITVDAPKKSAAITIQPAQGLISAANAAIIPTPVLDTVTVSFGATATYDKFLEFMGDLESNLRIMDVVHLSLATGSSKDGYDFTVELKTYWLRQQ